MTSAAKNRYYSLHNSDWDGNVTAQGRVTVSYTENSTRSHDCHDSFSLTVEFKTSVQLRCSNAGLTRDSFTLRVVSQDSCTVHFKLLSLSLVLMQLICLALLKLFVAQASLTVSTGTHHLLSHESVQALGLIFQPSSLCIFSRCLH